MSAVAASSHAGAQSRHGHREQGGSAGSSRLVTAAASNLRRISFCGLNEDASLILIDLKSRMRVNLELIEAIAALLSGGLTNSLAALVLARSSFEYSITTAWVLWSSKPDEWRERFASVLHDEVKQQARVGVIEVDESSGPGHDLLKFLEDFAGPDAPPTKPLPSMRDRLKAIGAERSYLLYGLTSHVSHGSRAAYQARYGWKHDKVKADQADEWRAAMGISLQSLHYTLLSLLDSVANCIWGNSALFRGSES
jgi:hypothetical protein